MAAGRSKPHMTILPDELIKTPPVGEFPIAQVALSPPGI
jgi:hypothetical protein